jgi:hypothetical protein
MSDVIPSPSLNPCATIRKSKAAPDPSQPPASSRPDGFAAAEQSVAVFYGDGCGKSRTGFSAAFAKGKK